jgi:hypothetical protein
MWILLMYGGIQFYVADQAMPVLGGGRDWWPAIWAMLMLSAPFLLWRLERHTAYHIPAVIGAWIIYGWMGYAFVFFLVGLSLFLANAAIHLSGLTASLPSSFPVLAGSSLAVWIYGFVAARRVRIERVRIVSDRLPPGFPGLRLVQISDLHLGVLIGRRRLDRVLHRIRSLAPDIVISTGDLVDAQAHFLDGLSSHFAALQPPQGKFAVTGNHERYAGLAHALDFHTRSGFRLLRGEAVEVGGIVLAGVDDPAVTGAQGDDAGVLAPIPADRFVVFLKHQPIVDARARFDLQLSGHTHKGQIFPFGLLVRLAYPMVAGLHALPGGAQLYVSRGTGTWGPPIRLFSPPEITLIELKRAS